MFDDDPNLKDLVDRLHTRSAGQDAELAAYFARRAAAEGPGWKEFDTAGEAFLSDKLVALDRDKAQFCYQMCRALRARRVVEAGTSFGVSTLYLAAAVRANGFAPGEGVVIGTEHEPAKAAAARANFEAAGLAPYIDLREGDLRQTLAQIDGEVDFMLMDIWTPMARPAIERVAPHLRAGAVVICDNSADFRDAYRHYFEFVSDPANRLRTMTLPFQGGLEFTVRI
jgi:predicted O-methyltransferase YrrM